MTIETWPASIIPVANTMTLGVAANTQSGGRSPFDGSQQTLELPGSRWAMEMRWQGLAVAQWRELQGFVAYLGGRAGRFTMALPESKFGRLGTATGSPTVRATSTGKVLKTTGWGGSGNVFNAGDVFGWLDPTGRPQLAMVATGVARSGSDADVRVSPFIRRTPNIGEPLILTAPTAVWMLADDAAMLDYEPGPNGFAATLKLEEALF